jgi:segregation and condensation protein A
MSAIDVKLNVFEGPLDLLLHLIEKNKVNIYDIPIVTITEQYLDYVNNMEEEDLDVMSEFLVMAATLIKIKSKMLLPKDEKAEEEEEDPREELVRRLLEYKMYKYAASELKDMELDGAKAFYKKESIPDEVKNYKPEVDTYELISSMDINLEKLNDIFKSVMRKQVDKLDPIRSKFKNIEREEISLEAKMAEIREKVRGLNGINFRTLLEMQASVNNIIVTFLAILELMKISAITIRQEELFGEIIIDSNDAV